MKLPLKLSAVACGLKRIPLNTCQSLFDALLRMLHAFDDLREFGNLSGGHGLDEWAEKTAFAPHDIVSRHIRHLVHDPGQPGVTSNFCASAETLVIGNHEPADISGRVLVVLKTEDTYVSEDSDEFPVVFATEV